MTGFAAGVGAQALLAIAAVAATLASPPVWRSRIAGALVAAVGVAGAATGAMAFAGGGSLKLGLALPGASLTLSPTPLGGLFMVVAGCVSALAAWYAIGYAHGPSSSVTAWTCLAVFVLAMQLVPAAGDALTFLLLWELMALSSAALVLTEHRERAEVRSGALWYAAMTQLSFLLILLGFTVLARISGGTSFDAMSHVPVRSAGASIAFALLALGFATKAGVVPMHVWLPRAHPVAPSHVSAVMSAAMVKLGVYGALLVVLRLLPDGPSWWGLLLLGQGAVSAVYGILHASVTSDLKRLLAYSTTENVGLMFLAVGTYTLLHAYGFTGPADAAVTACLLLVVSHAAFKTTLFLGAGAVLRATGERDLDRLGGLGVRMPWTSAAFGLAAMGAAALPVTCGFVAEWALLQSLIHGARADHRLVAAVMPAAVGVVALTAGLALMTFVKAFGIAFLARPRSSGAEAAVESPWSMRAALATGALLVVGVGLAPGAAAGVAARAAGAATVQSAEWVGIDLAGAGALLDPLALTVVALAVVVPALVVAAVLARRRPRRRVELAWGCGGERVSPRMQYTATSYAEPLSRVFDDALRPERDLEITHIEESRYLVERIQFRQQLVDVVESRLYRPAIAAADRVAVASRALANGSIGRYLAYSFGALIVVVLVVSL